MQRIKSSETPKCGFFMREHPQLHNTTRTINIHHCVITHRYERRPLGASTVAPDKAYLENTPNSCWWFTLVIHDLYCANTTIGSNGFPKRRLAKASCQFTQIVLVLNTQKINHKQSRAQQAATHICQSAIPICVVLIKVVNLPVPVEHLKCLTEGCSPPMAYEPG